LNDIPACGEKIPNSILGLTVRSEFVIFLIPFPCPFPIPLPVQGEGQGEGSSHI
jgi:hypothetical protein